MHVQWSADSAALLFLAEDRGRVGLFRLPLAAPQPALLVPGGAISGFARRATAACWRSRAPRPRHPPELFASRGDGSGARPIETLNRALLARHALGDVARIHDQGLARRAGADVGHLSARTSTRRRSGRCCTRSTAGRTPRTRTAGTSAGTPRCSPGAATSSCASTTTARPASGRSSWSRSRALRREGARRHRGRHRLHAEAGLHRPHAAGRHRRQLRRLHGRVHERPHRPLQGLCVPRRLLRLGEHDGDRRVLVLREGTGRVPLGRRAAGHAPVAAPLRQGMRRRRRW